jgi:hypothetical protein
MRIGSFEAFRPLTRSSSFYLVTREAYEEEEFRDHRESQSDQNALPQAAPNSNIHLISKKHASEYT